MQLHKYALMRFSYAICVLFPCRAVSAFDGSLSLSEHGPPVGVELFDEFGFVSAEIAVEQLVELRAMVHFRQVGKFMAYHIVAQIVGQKYKHVAERYYASFRALAENAVA